MDRFLSMDAGWKRKKNRKKKKEKSHRRIRVLQGLFRVCCCWPACKTHKQTISFEEPRLFARWSVFPLLPTCSVADGQPTQYIKIGRPSNSRRSDSAPTVTAVRVLASSQDAAPCTRQTRRFDWTAPSKHQSLLINAGRPLELPWLAWPRAPCQTDTASAVSLFLLARGPEGSISHRRSFVLGSPSSRCGTSCSSATPP